MSAMIERVAMALAEKAANDGIAAGTMEFWQGYARVAIEAMREPTEEMLQSAVAIEPDWSPAREIYQAMIDAAIKPDA